MGKYVVCLSPSNQDGNRYAYGNTTEAEQCQRIANATASALERCGITAVMADNTLGMSRKCQISDAANSDLHVPIHTNAHGSAGATNGGTLLFCSSLNQDTHGFKACNAIFNRLAPITPGNASEQVTAYPSLYEISTPTAPTAYIEVDFHDVPDIAKWIIEHVAEIGEAICHGICDYFNIKYVTEKEPEIDIGEGHDYSADARRKAIQKGIIKGVGTLPDGKIDYAWMESVTREELVTILDRMKLM